MLMNTLVIFLCYTSILSLQQNKSSLNISYLNASTTQQHEDTAAVKNEQEQVSPRNMSFPKDVPRPVSSYRIIGGKVIQPHAYPFLAALKILTKDSGFFCGGSLITNQVILTAAHCVDSKPKVIQVYLGRHNLRAHEPTGQYFQATQYTIHRGWSRKVLHHDIALIKLPRSATLNQYVQPVRLANINVTDLNWQTATAMGWGQTSDKKDSSSDVPREADVIITSLQYCYKIYGQAITHKHICTMGNHLSIKGTCNGDSGGPLVVNGIQIGIVSFGAVMCTEPSPSVYTRVSSYNSWIKEKLTDPLSFNSAAERKGHFVNLVVALALMYTFW